MTNLAGLSRLSACFASKRVKSHKCHIWCRLHGNTRCNQPLELDRSCTEVGNGARALLVGMCRWQSNSDPSVNSRLNNLVKILPEFALIERNQQVVMKRSESFSPSLFIFCSQFATIRHFYDSADLTRGVAAVAATIVEGHRSGCYTLDDAAC